MIFLVGGVARAAAEEAHCLETSTGPVCFGSDGEITDTDNGDGAGDGSGGGSGDSGGGSGGGSDELSPEEIADQEWEEWLEEAEKIEDENAEAYQAYVEALDAFERCVSSGAVIGSCVVPSPPSIQELPDKPDGEWVGFPVPDPPRFSPPEAAWSVITAKLRVPELVPGIGPSPEGNRWGMAVVGYPYWLWADGRTRVGAEASAGGLRVSLDAHVSGVVFDMGDGGRVECRGAGEPWVEWQRGGDEVPLPSPSCGYRWSRVSGEGRSYTVTMTTYWDVDWSAGGESGAEHLVDTSTRQVPVGELQSVVDG